MVRNFLKLFALILIPISALLFAISFYSYQTDQKQSLEALKQTMAVNLLAGKNSITNNLKIVSTDLKFFVHQIEDETDNNQITPEAKKRLSRVALNLLSAKKVYDQIRYIDETGKEIIRADYNDGNLAIISHKDQLQDKSNRYYFKNALKLDQGEIYLSPFDLNIEHGKIETPHKPMIRIATPVFDSNGHKRGIAILNYKGEKIIRDYKTVSKNASILNSDGYWLATDKSALEWGCMLGTDETFSKRFPNSWQKINATQKGGFKDKNGLFVYQTIYPLSEPGSTTLGEGVLAPLEKPYFWIIVSWVPSDILNSMADKELQKNTFFFLPIFLIIIITTLVITYFRCLYVERKARIKEMEASIAKQEAQHKEHTRLINERLHDAIESFPDGFVLYDSDDRMVLCNQAFREMWAGINDLIKPGVYFRELAEAIEVRGLARKEEATKKRNWVYDRQKEGFKDYTLEIQLANGRWILHHDHLTKDGGHAGIRIDITESFWTTNGWYFSRF